MALEFGVTAALSNTRFTPVAALLAYYQTKNVLEPLEMLRFDGKQAPNKLVQVFISILTGCEYISVINTRLRPEIGLAQVKRIAGFAEQSTIARSLNELTQMNLVALEAAVGQISARCSRAQRHDWRGYLELDFDLSGLPCGKQAEGSRKGYFSGKKTSLDGNWHA
jgi:hypothetical protein